MKKFVSISPTITEKKKIKWYIFEVSIWYINYESEVVGGGDGPATVAADLNIKIYYQKHYCVSVST